MANRRGKGGSSNRFPLLGLQNHCRWWLQSWNLSMIASWQESNDKPRQCVEKQTHYSADKVHIVKAMVFPVVTHGCKSWIVKKAEHQRIDGFKLWCWRRLLKVLWTARRPNQSILRGINPEYSLEELMLKLRSGILVICFQQTTHWKSPWWWEWLRAEEDVRGWAGWTASPMHWTWIWANSGRQWGQGGLVYCSPLDCKELDITRWLNNNNI